MPPDEEQSFNKALINDFTSIQSSLSRVDLREAQASVEADRITILGWVERDLSFEQLNQQIIKQMRDWIASVAYKRLQEITRQSHDDKENRSMLEDTLTLQNNIASLLKEQGKLDEAEPLCQQAVAMSRSKLGNDHHITITSLSNLATLYTQQGQLGDEAKLGEAELLCREALDVCQRKWGTDHECTLIALNNLASLHKERGNLDDAEMMYRQCLAVSRSVLGENHHDTLTSENNLASLLKRQGKFKEAEDLYLKVLEARETKFGERHPRTLVSLSNYALILREREKFEEALTLHRKCYEIRREVLGDEHHFTQQSYENVVSACRTMGKKISISAPHIMDRSKEGERFM